MIVILVYQYISILGYKNIRYFTLTGFLRKTQETRSGKGNKFRLASLALSSGQPVREALASMKLCRNQNQEEIWQH